MSMATIQLQTLELEELETPPLPIQPPPNINASGTVYGFRTRLLSCIEENDTDSVYGSSMPRAYELMQQADETFQKLNVEEEQQDELSDEELEADNIAMIDESRLYEVDYLDELVAEEQQSTTELVDSGNVEEEDCWQPSFNRNDIMNTSCYGTLNNSFGSEALTPKKAPEPIYATPEKRRESNRSFDSTCTASQSSSIYGGSMNSSLDHMMSVSASAATSTLRGNSVPPMDLSLVSADAISALYWSPDSVTCVLDNGDANAAEELNEEMAAKCLSAAESDLQSIRRLLEHDASGGTVCPSCRISFDKGKRRKLIDTCGHERCYSCMFRNDQCPMCMNSSLKEVINCYWGTWANYRQGDGKFTYTNVDASLCTHLSYCFFGIDDTGEFKSLDNWLDLDSGLGFIKKTIALKQQHPNLKVMAVVGGWNEGSVKYSSMAADPGKRSKFISSSLAFIKQYGFDGLDLDWEYPGQRGGNVADRANFVILLRMLKEVFDQHKLTLSIAVGASDDTARASYDISAIANEVSFINLMTYDFHMASDGYLGLNAPLQDMEKAVRLWLKQGAPANKLLLGMPFYGHSYQLKDNAKNRPNDGSSGPGSPGIYTGSSGFLGYNEICLNKWKTLFDTQSSSPFAFQENQWVGFDNPYSIKLKMDLVNSYNLAGAMTWSIETDDFLGRCGECYPLLKAMNRAVGREVGQLCMNTDYYHYDIIRK
ncbi:Cht9 [Drosophila busckii]|uniref:Cht9 n=1 Tax=Drosophila busckii TaxID=30019 RepID=A0A0M4EZV1_DROBS|nr:Cht9 [Drosophila busckii]